MAASVFVDSANVKWIPQPSESLWLLFMNICLYWVLTLYLDKVLPNENGYRGRFEMSQFFCRSALRLMRATTTQNTHSSF